MHFSSLPCVLHAPPISISLIFLTLLNIPGYPFWWVKSWFLSLSHFFDTTRKFVLIPLPIMHFLLHFPSLFPLFPSCANSVNIFDIVLHVHCHLMTCSYPTSFKLQTEKRTRGFTSVPLNSEPHDRLPTKLATNFRLLEALINHDIYSRVYPSFFSNFLLFDILICLHPAIVIPLQLAMQMKFNI
jgi:hypothetical protein